MADQYFTSMIDPSRRLSFDTTALLTTSTINALHFPGLASSGISESAGSRRTSFLLDGVGMCESMTESFCSTGGQDDTPFLNNTNTLSSDSSMNHANKLEKKDSLAQKKRRSRKAQYDASIDGTPLDKIETVFLNDEQNEPDDAWLYEVPSNGHKHDSNTDNIFSWVHKEFKTNDINANKHRLLCKLDDMSHASTIRSVSCHNFADNQRVDSFKRSSTEQQVNSDPPKNGRFSSPLRATTPIFQENGKMRPVSPAIFSPLRSSVTTTHLTVNGNAPEPSRSRDPSKEREKEPLDYTDLEVMAKVQLEKLRQADQQGPLSKRFGGSNVSLASTSSTTSVSISNRPGSKPPVAPKSVVIRSSVKPNAYRRTNTQTLSMDGSDVSKSIERKPSITTTNRTSLLPPNSANNIRTRPPVAARPIQPYRGSHTSVQTNGKLPTAAPSSVPRNGKKPEQNLASTFPGKTSDNGLLHDVSNKPLTGPIRSQLGPQRRTIVPQTSAHSSVEQIPPSTSTDVSTNGSLPRSSSSLSQGRKSGIPTVGKPQKPSSATVTRHHSLSSRRTTMNGF